MKSFFKSVGGRKVFCGFLMLLFGLIIEHYGLDITIKEFFAYSSGLLSFIGVEGVADLIDRWKSLPAEAKQKVEAFVDYQNESVSKEEEDA